MPGETQIGCQAGSNERISANIVRNAATGPFALRFGLIPDANRLGSYPYIAAFCGPDALSSASWDGWGCRFARIGPVWSPLPKSEVSGPGDPTSLHSGSGTMVNRHP